METFLLGSVLKRYLDVPSSCATFSIASQYEVIPKAMETLIGVSQAFYISPICFKMVLFKFDQIKIIGIAILSVLVIYSLKLNRTSCQLVCQ